MAADFIYSNDSKLDWMPRAVPARVRGLLTPWSDALMTHPASPRQREHAFCTKRVPLLPPSKRARGRKHGKNRNALPMLLAVMLVSVVVPVSAWTSDLYRRSSQNPGVIQTYRRNIRVITGEDLMVSDRASSVRCSELLSEIMEKYDQTLRTLSLFWKTTDVQPDVLEVIVSEHFRRVCENTDGTA